MNISTYDEEMIFAKITSRIDDIKRKYKPGDEDLEFELDKHDATFKLFSELDVLFRKNFEFRSDLLMMNDDEHMPGKTLIMYSYTNTNNPEGYKVCDLPKDSIVIGWTLENNHIDINGPNDGYAYIDVLGPTALIPAFNEKKHGKEPIFNLVCNNLSQAICTVISNMMDTDKPKGSACINVENTIVTILRKWIDAGEDEDAKNLRQAFCGMIEEMDEAISDLYEGCTDWMYISPNNKEIEPRYVCVYLMEKDAGLLKHLDLALVPDTVCVAQFTLDEVPKYQVTIGTSPLATAWIKDGKVRMRKEACHESIIQNEKYEDIMTEMEIIYKDYFGQ